MEQTAIPSTDRKPTPVLYSLHAITIASGLGSVFAGAFLLYRNLTLVDRDEDARTALRYGAVACLLVILLLLLVKVPSHFDRLFALSLEGVQVAAVYFYTKRVFAESFREHQLNGGAFVPTWRAIGLSIPLSLVPICLFLLLMLVFPNGSGVADEDAFHWMVAYHYTTEMQDQGAIAWEQMEREIENYPWMEELRQVNSSNGVSPSISVANPRLDKFLAVEFVGTPTKHAFFCSWGKMGAEEGYRTLGCDSIVGVVPLFRAFFRRDVTSLDSLFARVGVPQEEFLRNNVARAH